MSTLVSPLKLAVDPLRRVEARFVRPHRRTVARVLAGMLAQSVLLLPIPLLQGWVLDHLLAYAGAPEETRDGAALTRVALLGLSGTLLCLAARAGLAWWGATTMSRVSLEVVHSVTDALHRKLQRLPIAFYDREQTGCLMARITSDVGSLLIFLNSAALQLVCDLILALGIA